MAVGRSLDDRLARLNAIEGPALSDADRCELDRALAGRNHHLAAKAAQLVARFGLHDRVAELLAAYDRFMQDPDRTDRGCRAKRAIVEALNALGSDEVDVFRRGVRHVQMEPVWGGQVDTAAGLRAACAHALVRLGHPDVFFELAALLMDADAEARRAAVQALSFLAGDASELLLRTRVLAGDAEADVLGACFAGLMQINPDRSLDFVARYLDAAAPEVVQEAAVALGESRHPGAFALLRDRWQASIDPAFKTMLLLPMALTRGDEAYAFLLAVLRDGHPDYAGAALDALKLYAAPEARRQEIRAAAAARHDPRRKTAGSEEGEHRT